MAPRNDQSAKHQQVEDPRGVVPRLAEALEETIAYLEHMVASSGEDNGERAMIERFERLIAEARGPLPQDHRSSEE